MFWWTTFGCGDSTLRNFYYARRASFGDESWLPLEVAWITWVVVTGENRNWCFRSLDCGSSEVWRNQSTLVLKGWKAMRFLLNLVGVPFSPSATHLRSSLCAPLLLVAPAWSVLAERWDQQVRLTGPIRPSACPDNTAVRSYSQYNPHCRTPFFTRWSVLQAWGVPIHFTSRTAPAWRKLHASFLFIRTRDALSSLIPHLHSNSLTLPRQSRQANP